MFKLLFWPGSQTVIYFGAITGIVLLSFIYLYRSEFSLEEKNELKYIVPKNIIFLAIIGACYILSTKSILEIKFRHDPELGRLKHELLQDPNNELKKKAIDDYSIEYILLKFFTKV
jgi:hypothetical protein